MILLRSDRRSRLGLIMLLLLALVFAPLASADISVAALDSMVVQEKSEHTTACKEMHELKAHAVQQADSSDCCDQNTDCKTQCQNLVLTHLPVSALLGSLAFQHRSTGFISSSSPQMLAGIAATLDPRPPRT